MIILYLLFLEDPFMWEDKCFFGGLADKFGKVSEERQFFMT